MQACSAVPPPILLVAGMGRGSARACTNVEVGAAWQTMAATLCQATAAFVP